MGGRQSIFVKLDLLKDQVHQHLGLLIHYRLFEVFTLSLHLPMVVPEACCHPLLFGTTSTSGSGGVQLPHPLKTLIPRMTIKIPIHMIKMRTEDWSYYYINM